LEKVNVYSLDGQKKGSMDIPYIFKMQPRKDLVQKANEIFESRNKQTQGRDKRAGLRNTATSWGTGHGMSRAPRIKGSGFSNARNVGRVPFAVGGRRTHPIKTEKVLQKKINKKTYGLSIISAISASGDVNWVKSRGHRIENVPEIPLVVDDKIQTVKKTSAAYQIFSDLGLKDELIKSKNSKKVRAGKGKRRGRKYKKKKGVLFIIKEDFGIIKATRNIPGIDIIKYDNISINNLAPGGSLGRLILWSQSAFNELNKIDVMV
jgi:large subunit ribosomal protein L4e